VLYSACSIRRDVRLVSCDARSLVVMYCCHRIRCVIDILYSRESRFSCRRSMLSLARSSCSGVFRSATLQFLAAGLLSAKTRFLPSVNFELVLTWPKYIVQRRSARYHSWSTSPEPSSDSPSCLSRILTEQTSGSSAAYASSFSYRLLMKSLTLRLTLFFTEES
jgi:hypothetical protein